MLSPTITTRATADREPRDEVVRHPPRPGRPRPPLRTFRACQSGRFVALHEGFGLELDDVIAWYVEGVFGDPESGMATRPFDVAIIDGEAIVAIVHRLAGPPGSCRVTRLDGAGEAEPANGSPAHAEPVIARTPHDSGCDVFLYPPAPGPLVSYSVAASGQLSTIHRGRGLRLDAVLDFLCTGRTLVGPNYRAPDGEGWDLAVFDGERQVALVRCHGDDVGDDGACHVLRFDLPAAPQLRTVPERA